MNTRLANSEPPLPTAHSPWWEWLTYGLHWAANHMSITELARGSGRSMTVHAYRETEPGSRWRALYAATWPAYRNWYLREGSDARPSLPECRRALTRYLP